MISKEDFQPLKDNDLGDYFSFLLYQNDNSDLIDFAFGNGRQIITTLGDEFNFDPLHDYSDGYREDDIKTKFDLVMQFIWDMKPSDVGEAISYNNGCAIKLFDSDHEWNEVLPQLIRSINNRKVCFRDDDGMMFDNLFLNIWPCYLKFKNAPKYLEDVFYSIFKQVNELPDINVINKDLMDLSDEADARLRLSVSTKFYDELKNIQSELVASKSDYSMALGQVYVFESLYRALERIKSE